MKGKELKHALKLARKAAKANGLSLTAWLASAITREARRQLGWVSDEEPCHCKYCLR